VIQNRSGIIAVTEDASGQADMLYGGGVYDGTFNIDPVMNSNSIRRAYMIAGLHRNPQEVLEIGLASGSWSRVVAAYQPVQKHSIVEINPGYLALMDRYRPQRDLLSDRKVTIHIDDGRRWLNRNPEAKFDLIVQNTTWHWRSQITNLLSEEYLELCKRHLKDGGVMYYNATGSEDVAYTAAKVFRHVVRYKNFVAGSERPFALTAAEIRGNLMKFRFGEKATFASEEPAIRRIVEELCSSDLSDKAEELRRRRGLWKITDDNMATEYKRRAWYAPQRSWGAFFRQRRESHSGG
jgi:spermidine synthase